MPPNGEPPRPAPRPPSGGDDGDAGDIGDIGDDEFAGAAKRELEDREGEIVRGGTGAWSGVVPAEGADAGEAVAAGAAEGKDSRA